MDEHLRSLARKAAQGDPQVVTEQLRVRRTESREVCPYCKDTLQETKTTCKNCNASYHSDCWNELGGCGILGCTGAGITDGRCFCCKRPVSEDEIVQLCDSCGTPYHTDCRLLRALCQVPKCKGRTAWPKGAEIAVLSRLRWQPSPLKECAFRPLFFGCSKKVRVFYCTDHEPGSIRVNGWSMLGVAIFFLLFLPWADWSLETSWIISAICALLGLKLLLRDLPLAKKIAREHEEKSP